MINSNVLDEIELQIIQQHLEFSPGNALLISNDSDLINSILSDNLQVLSNPDKIISDHVDNLLLTNSLEENISKENKKFDTIIIGDLFEQIKNPEPFLQYLHSVLNDNGAIVCSISNFSHINKIFNLLIGNIESTFFNTSRFYDLNNFLIFLNQSNMHTTKLLRVKQEFSSESMNLDETLIPSQLIEMYKKIPDHDVAQYVFMIGKGKSVSSETLDFSTQFPKNYLLPKLQEFFETFVELKSSIIKKDKIIQGHEESIKDIANNAVPALAKKDEVIEGLENSIKEQKNYAGAALAKKDEVIQGYEESIKEQKDYIENLKKHNNQLESQLKKFKFWKR